MAENASTDGGMSGSESDTGGGYGGGGNWGNEDVSSWGGMEGAPDVGTLGGTLADSYGETSSTMGGGLSAEQSAGNQEVNFDPFGYDFSAAGFQSPESFNLGQMFGYEAPQGLPTYQGDYAGNKENYGFSNFAESPFGKGLRGLLGMTPVGAVANVGYNLAKGAPLATTLAGLVPGAVGTAARIGAAAYDSPSPASSLGRSAAGMLGSSVGSALGGPVGGMLGGWAGNAAATAGMQGRGSPAGASTGSGGGFNLGDAAMGLAGLYQGHQSQKNARELQAQQGQTDQALQTQMANLANMYSQNSPYAQALRQTLARKDAAAGRNSQYGAREVDLQARLAAQQAQASQSLSGLANARQAGFSNSQAANNAAQSAKGQQLQRLLALGKSSGLTDRIQSGLSSMFPQQQSFEPAPQYDMNDWGSDLPNTMGTGSYL
ncbi:MAG: hypothetical protein WAV48_04870 [Candidatus Magasanikiibacteriota bacterium]